MNYYTVSELKLHWLCVCCTVLCEVHTSEWGVCNFWLDSIYIYIYIGTENSVFIHITPNSLPNWSLCFFSVFFSSLFHTKSGIVVLVAVEYTFGLLVSDESAGGHRPLMESLHAQGSIIANCAWSTELQQSIWHEWGIMELAQLNFE